MEEWKDVVGYEELFSISNRGRLFSKRTNRILRLNPVNGYLSHVTKIGGRQGIYKCLKIHQLVAKAFKENPNNYPVVNHIDGDKFNNCEDNLEWVTISGNVQHAFREGLVIPRKGEECPNAKLTEELINFCKENYIPRDREFSIAAMSRRFGVNRATLGRAIRGDTWNHLP